MDHIEVDKIKAFVNITLSSFNFTNISLGLSGFHWQQTLKTGHVFRV